MQFKIISIRDETKNFSRKWIEELRLLKDSKLFSNLNINKLAFEPSHVLNLNRGGKIIILRISDSL